MPIPKAGKVSFEKRKKKELTPEEEKEAMYYMERAVKVPMKDIDPEKAYQVKQVGSHVYYKELPNKPTISEAVVTEPLEKRVPVPHRFQQPYYRRFFVPSSRLQPLFPGYKYYVTTESGTPTVSVVERQHAFTPKAETAYERLQKAGVAE